MNSINILNNKYRNECHRLVRAQPARSERNTRPAGSTRRGNPRGSQLIMENRREQREELNDILGDMSPYWNMDTEIEDDSPDYDDTGYSDDEDEYVEDW